jgi:AcrR family transcriptional regulator
MIVVLIPHEMLFSVPRWSAAEARTVRHGKKANDSRYPQAMTPDGESSRRSGGRSRRAAAVSPVAPKTARSVAPTTARRELVEKQIFEHAVRLFAERGFAGTSLQDIAKATGLTRPALYYYVNSKEDLLHTLVRQETEDFAATLAEIGSDVARTPLQRVREMVYQSALRQAKDPARFRLLIRSEAELPEDVLKDYNTGRRKVLEAYSNVISEGIASGVLRPVDTKVCALGLIGMSNWIAWWHHPRDNHTVEEIAQEIAELAAAGIASQGEATTGQTGPGHALALLKRDIALLEDLLERDGD